MATTIALALAYYAGARLGLSMALVRGQVTPLWPPTGIALAALLTFGPASTVPGIALGALAVNATLAPGALALLNNTAGNTLAPVVAYALLRRVGFRPDLARLRDAAAFVGLTTAAMTISATFGTVSLLVGDALTGRSFVRVWLTWWTGDAVGALVFAPLLLSLRIPRRHWSARELAEAGGLLPAVAGATWVSFHVTYGVRFVVFPVLVVVSMRLRLRGAAPAALIACTIATYTAASHEGSFAGMSDTGAVVSLQIFNLCVALTCYLLAALTTDRRQAREDLALAHQVQAQLVDERTADLRAALDRRKAAERHLTQIVELAPDAMVFVDDGGVITRVNKQTEALFGYSRDELVGRTVETLIPESLRKVHEEHRSAFATASHPRAMGEGLDLLARRRDGSQFPVEVSLAPLDEEGRLFVAAAIRDVTLRKAQQDLLAYRAHHDDLTGLPNRALLTERLTQALRNADLRPTTTAVFFIDVDRFKWVNDSLGHEAGDQLLCTLATRLTNAARPSDTVARFGGDEFVVLAEHLENATDALSIADRLLAVGRHPIDLSDGHTVVPTLSIGIVVSDGAHADPADLLRDADAAMYGAKEAGRDRVMVHAPEINAAMRDRLALAVALRRALQRGEIVAHFQPMVDIATGEPVGLEALARWPQPDGTMMFPDAFVPLAEEIGQIELLDRQVILSAARQLAAMAERCPAVAGLRLSLNVSLRHVNTSRLSQTLDEAVRLLGERAGNLVIEVTESTDVPAEDFESFLTLVKDKGMQVAIDDFGTGFSGLSRLTGLSVDSLKIDRSFISTVHLDPRNRAIVSAMARLGLALGARVVAEGVEDEEQLEVVRALGCTTAQGYLWAHALDGADVVAWLDGASVSVPAQRSPLVWSR